MTHENTTKMRIGLAPMEGVVDPLVRQILTSAPGIDFCTTEFIRVTNKLNPKRVFYKYAPELASQSKTSSGVPVFIQLLGGDPEWLALNAHEAFKLGAFGVDLNFGCPAKKVNSHDGGAVLLQKPERLYNIITASRRAVEDKIPVTAKVRLGCNDKSLYLEIAAACSEAQAHWMTVHARTKKEGYQPPAHWHLIKEMKKVCKIPVIANGDIFKKGDAFECISQSGCEDIMIGRGLMRDPYLAQKIKGLVPVAASPLQPLNNYLSLSQTIYGEKRTIGRAKQWLKMILDSHKSLLPLFDHIKRLDKLRDIQDKILDFDRSHSEAFNIQ